VNVAARARNVALAETLAEQRIAMLRLLRSDQVNVLPDTIAFGRFARPTDAFTWHVTSVPVVNEYYLYDVRVTIAWQDGAYNVATRLYAPPDADTNL
jgi:hypothetical protein